MLLFLDRDVLNVLMNLEVLFEFVKELAFVEFNAVQEDVDLVDAFENILLLLDAVFHPLVHFFHFGKTFFLAGDLRFGTEQLWIGRLVLDEVVDVFSCFAFHGGEVDVLLF